MFRPSLIALLLCGTVFPVAESLAAPENRVGVVDVQKVITTSKAGAVSQKQYETAVKEAQAKIELKKKELEDLRASYKAKMDSLSAVVKKAKEEEIIALDKEVKRGVQDSQERLQRDNAMLVADLAGKIREIAAQIGKDEKFSVILERNAQNVIYADGAVDITDKVTAKVDQGDAKAK